ncbi:MAG: substrate-binding domain-containing protein [Spirochaetales bacterium]|nr:substrate-binding domain-containing protein [Spirochaetales bacterium]
MADKNRYRIALFIPYLEGDDYNELLWQSINKKCISLDIDLYIFPSRNLNDNSSHKFVFNEIFSFFNKNLFDGVIISASAISTYIGQQEFEKHANNLLNIPIVNISYNNIKTTSVGVDNTLAMNMIMDHLVNVHSFKKFSYLSGPASNPESINRLESIKIYCKNNNLELLNNNIFWGDFTVNNLEETLYPLYHKGKIEVDVLVCANDSMAAGAIDLLKNKGFKIPEDIAVTGFDDSNAAIFQNPKITTIRQPLEELANKSVELIYAKLTGNTQINHILIEPILKIRNSCGCSKVEDSESKVFKLFMKTKTHITRRNDFEKLLSSEDLLQLTSNLRQFFSKNSIHSYFLLLKNMYTQSNDIQLLLGCRENKYIACGENYCSFAEGDFIPENLLPKKNRITMVTLPLVSFNKFYGFLLIEEAIEDKTFYEDTLVNLTSTLTNVLSLKELRETHKLLVESEKLAFLGNLVSGLAHEINTPIGVTLTAATFLSDIIRDLEGHYKNDILTKTIVEHFFENSKRSLSLINDNIDSTIKLINRFKSMSANSDYELNSVFDIVLLISSTSQKEIATYNKRVELNLDLPPIVIVNSYSGIISHIIRSLVSNSMIHGFKNMEQGSITISLKNVEDNIEIIYSDNGLSCTDNQILKIFNPFFTTQRAFGHTGLGLTIIYNLIKNKLMGNIYAYLKDEKLHFKITIPQNIA